MAETERKLIANNKKAYHDYFILEKYEAGIVLHGTEVKSLRMGRCKAFADEVICVAPDRICTFCGHVGPVLRA